MKTEQYTTNTYEYGLVSVVVHRPVLSDDERRKREEHLKTALACYGKDVVRRQKGA